MENATHFIEIYKSNYTGNINQSIKPLSINAMPKVLLSTAESKHLQTIAVWKIKPKNKKQ